MASITKTRNPKTGTVYVYSSESYWDKELKAPRTRKKLLGKLDEETGEIIPTSGKRGRKPKQPPGTDAGNSDYRKMYETCSEELRIKDLKITEMTTQILELEEKLRNAQKKLDQIGKVLEG